MIFRREGGQPGVPELVGVFFTPGEIFPGLRSPGQRREGCPGGRSKGSIAAAARGAVCAACLPPS